MEKENLEIRKASEELTAEDLGKVNGGIQVDVQDMLSPPNCQKDCGCH